MQFIYVFIGGGLGAITRFGISKIIKDSTFPYATLTANVISCIILGYLLGITLQKELDSKTQLFLITGFCGGFSTFSTFSAESFKLIQNNHISTAVLYMVTSIIVCLISIGLGLKVAS